MNRLALFDCDGTLVDSQHSIVRAMADAFAAAGLAPPDRESTLSIVGLSLTEAMAVLLPEAMPEMHAKLGQDYKSAFQALRALGVVSEPLYEGIADAIEALDRAGWCLGVATGKSDRGLAICLDHHGLKHRFITLQTADRHPSKPHPSMVEAAMAEAGASPATTVVIGDTSYDMEMARSAGATAIGVTWGYHDRDGLLAAGAQHVVDSPAELGTLLESFA